MLCVYCFASDYFTFLDCSQVTYALHTPLSIRDELCGLCIISSFDHILVLPEI